MSWVTDVVLFYGLGESWIDATQEGAEYNPSNIRHIGISPCLTGINAWLRENNQVELINFDGHASAYNRKSMQAYVWGAAFNFLDIEDFIDCVKAQPWREPENVQVMYKDEEECRFTLVQLGDTGEPSAP